MNETFRSIVESATDAGTLAKRLLDSGLKSVSGKWNRLPLFGAIRTLDVKGCERDETHYLLVPLPDQQFAVYTKRVIPTGCGITNSLPKARIFHLPDASAQTHLETLLIKELGVRAEEEKDLPLSELLERFGEEIDKKSQFLSGGLILVGGVVSLANPLLGLGIMTQALVPSFAASVAKSGSEYLGEKVRALASTRSKNKANRSAMREVKRIRPEIFQNAVLNSFDAMFADPDGVYDPFMDSRNWVDEFESYRYFAITCEAVGEVFRSRINKLDARVEKWLNHIEAMDSADSISSSK